MAISTHDAMRIIQQSPDVTAYWARTLLPHWTDRPFAPGSYPTRGMYSVVRAGRTINYFVNAADVAAAALTWAKANLDHEDPNARGDARCIANNEALPWFYAITIDEIIQTATLGSVRYHPSKS